MSKIIRIFVTLVCVLVTVACAPGIAPVEATACLSDFEATVHQGNSKGLAVVGKLLFVLDNAGQLTGRVDTNDGGKIPVVGQVNGRAINLAFTVGDEKYLFGVGAATEPIYSCAGVWGGGFTGPEPGDSGDWLTNGGIPIEPGLEALYDLDDIIEVTIDTGNPPGGSGLPESGGGVEIKIPVPPETIERCFNTRNNQVDLNCLQAFCTEQKAGTAKIDTVGTSGSSHVCDSGN